MGFLERQDSCNRHPMLRDLRYGFRILARNPAFAVTAVLTIAFGIGATTTIFSVLYSVVLEPLPFREPERLVRLHTVSEKLNLTSGFIGAPMRATCANKADFWKTWRWSAT